MSKPDDKPNNETGGEWQRRLAPLTAFLDIGGRIVALTSLLTALLYYFGFARSKALYSYFGIEQSILSFQTPDYILRSIEGLTEPLRWILTLLLGLIWMHYQLLRWLEQPGALAASRRTVLVRFIIVLGIGFVVVNAVTMPYAARLPFVLLFYPTIWTVGIGLIAYALYLAGSSLAEGKSDRPSLYAQVRRMSLWVLAGLLLYGLFWVVAIAANVAGKDRAAYIANYLDELPDVVIYSETDLHLQANGVDAVTDCPTPTTCWTRYSGLKFLLRSDHKFFLLPALWKKGQDMTIIIPEADTIRIEVAPGRFP